MLFLDSRHATGRFDDTDMTHFPPTPDMGIVYCEEWNGNEPISLKELKKLIPVLMKKYGADSVINFETGYNDVTVEIAPSNKRGI